jgi:uncharacterized protein
MINPAFVNLIINQFPVEITGIHGVLHWARVLENGRLVARYTAARVDVIEYFALLHDSRRFSNSGDRMHGPRAANFASSLRAKWIPLDDDGFALLQHAIRHHAEGGCYNDETVQACWDADRLDLARAYIEPKPHLLCTLPGRETSTISWANERSRSNFIAENVLAEWGVDWDTLKSIV